MLYILIYFLTCSSPKELYNIIPYAFYAETAYKQALALVENNGN